MAQTEMSFGFPRMRKEPGERRDFCPSLISKIAACGARVTLEHGYGSGMGFDEKDFLTGASRACFTTHEETCEQDYVVVLRYPNQEELELIRPGTCLVSMIHYPTRPQRVRYLKSRQIEGISLDSLKDKNGKRLVENLKSVAWNGLEVSFDLLARIYPPPGLAHPDRPPIKVTILGSGGVGCEAVAAAIRYGNRTLHQSLTVAGCPGVIVTVVDFDITNLSEVMLDLLSSTDILVDATQRVDASQVIIPNEWISRLPGHAVILDLAVDPYDFTTNPPSVKGIEGIPGGDLDQFVFEPDDPAYSAIPKNVSTAYRRHVVSCYSWPGIHPRECMQTYSEQLLPILLALIEKGGIGGIDPEGSEIEQSIARAQLTRYPST